MCQRIKELVLPLRPVVERHRLWHRELPARLAQRQLLEGQLALVEHRVLRLGLRRLAEPLLVVSS